MCVRGVKEIINVGFLYGIGVGVDIGEGDTVLLMVVVSMYIRYSVSVSDGAPSRGKHCVHSSGRG